MMKNRPILYIASLFAIGTASFYATQSVARVQPKSVLSVQPFSLEKNVFRIPKDGGTPQLVRIKKLARKSDGTTSEMWTIGPLSWGLYSRKIVSPDGTTRGIIDEIQRVSSFKMRQAKVDLLRSRLSHPPPNCLYNGMKPNGQDVQLGLRVYNNIEESTGERRVFSFAPDLGCEVVASVTEQLVSGIYKKDMEERLVYFAAGEPGNELFADWSFYKESTLSQMKSSALSTRGVTQCDKCDPSLPALDALHEEFMKKNALP